MAFDDLAMRLVTGFARNKIKKELLSRLSPPSYGDILHDGLVNSGETIGGSLGAATGILGGEAVGGPPGAIAGQMALGPAGALGGGWAAHGAYLGGQLVKDILTHPEAWTVDAAGAIVPVTHEPVLLSNILAQSDAYGGSPSEPILQSGIGTVGQSNSEAPVRFLSRREVDPRGNSMSGWTRSVPSGNAPGSFPGMIASVSGNEFQNTDQPLSGGLAGLIQDYLRANPEPAH